tara:strand:+ start:1114 stop:1431 length:318 start_codon:yes stop_codon:yes gene_type:complete
MNDDTMTHEEKMQRDIGKMEGLVGGLNAVKKLIREHDSTPGSEIIEARRNIERQVKFSRYRFFENYGDNLTFDMLCEIYPKFNPEKITNLVDSIREKVENGPTNT